MKAFVIRCLAGVGLFGGALVACLSTPPMQSGDLKGVEMQLPVFLGDYYSQPRRASEVEKRLLPDDTAFAYRVYYRPTADGPKDIMQFGIVLAGADSRSIHKPEVCLDGQGWTFLGQANRVIAVTGGHSLEVRDLYMSRKEVEPDGVREIRAHYMYWFIGRELSTPSNWERQLVTMSDNIIHLKNHRWAYANLLYQLDETLPAEEANRQALEKMDAFVGAIAPWFMKQFGAVPGMPGVKTAEEDLKDMAAGDNES
jgi:hypothetical protein